jgi:hypothetical protein
MAGGPAIEATVMVAIVLVAMTMVAVWQVASVVVHIVLQQTEIYLDISYQIFCRSVPNGVTSKGPERSGNFAECRGPYSSVGRPSLTTGGQPDIDY